MIRIVTAMCGALLAGCASYPDVTSSTTPSTALATCIDAISQTIRKHGPTTFSVGSAGPETQAASGRAEVPLNIRIQYPNEDGERQSEVRCELDASGTVVDFH